MTEQEYLQEHEQLKLLSERHRQYQELKEQIKYDTVLIDQLKNTSEIYGINIQWSMRSSTLINIPFEQIKDILIKYAENDLQKTITSLESL